MKPNIMHAKNVGENSRASVSIYLIFFPSDFAWIRRKLRDYDDNTERTTRREARK